MGRLLIERIRDLEGVRIHDLYETYPDLYINRENEQALLLEADLIVFQYPMYWHSTPAILKEWQDVVLERGWAYGTGGTHLHGKDFLVVTTTGGPAIAFAEASHNRFSMSDLLRPLEATVMLCGMNFLRPITIHGTHAIGIEEAEAHAARYRALLSDYIRRGAVAFDGGTES